MVSLWSLSVLCGGAGFQDGGLRATSDPPDKREPGDEMRLFYFGPGSPCGLPCQGAVKFRDHPVNPIPHPIPAPQSHHITFINFPCICFPPNSICVYKHQSILLTNCNVKVSRCLLQGQAGRSCRICSSGVARTRGGVSSSVKGSWTHRISFLE